MKSQIDLLNAEYFLRTKNMYSILISVFYFLLSTLDADF